MSGNTEVQCVKSLHTFKVPPLLNNVALKKKKNLEEISPTLKINRQIVKHKSVTVGFLQGKPSRISRGDKLPNGTMEYATTTTTTTTTTIAFKTTQC